MNRRTKALAIPKNVKNAVCKRDGGACVICLRPGVPNAHVVRRSQGGLGIEQNIVCLCQKHHKQFDEGKTEERNAAYVQIVRHLKGFYPDWNQADMVYRKGKYDTD